MPIDTSQIATEMCAILDAGLEDMCSSEDPSQAITLGLNSISRAQKHQKEYGVENCQSSEAREKIAKIFSAIHTITLKLSPDEKKSILLSNHQKKESEPLNGNVETVKPNLTINIPMESKLSNKAVAVEVVPLVKPLIANVEKTSLPPQHRQPEYSFLIQMHDAIVSPFIFFFWLVDHVVTAITRAPKLMSDSETPLARKLTGRPHFFEYYQASQKPASVEPETLSMKPN